MGSEVISAAVFLILLSGISSLAIWEERKTGMLSALLLLICFVSLPVFVMAAVFLTEGALIIGVALMSPFALALITMFARRGARIVPPLALFLGVSLPLLALAGIA